MLMTEEENKMMDHLLMLELLLAIMMKYGERISMGEPVTEDPFRLSMMTVHAAIRKLQMPDFSGYKVDGARRKREEYKIIRKAKIKSLSISIKKAIKRLDSVLSKLRSKHKKGK